MVAIFSVHGVQNVIEKDKLDLKLSGVHVVEKRRRRGIGGDQAPPSDHWPPLMLPPDFFASKQTPPVSLR